MSEHPEAAQYTELANNIDFHESNRFAPEGEQKVALVDIDETICFYRKGKRRYDLAKPDYDNIAKINKLYDEGWKIIYWTARGSISKKDYYTYTFTQLKSWGCKFHELSTGTKGEFKKPAYDLLVDDKAKRIEEL